MDIKEAEEFFKKYNGQGFHMWREEEYEYKQYVALRIPPETEEQWRQELIRYNFEHFFDFPEKVWLRFDSVLDIMKSTKTHWEENCAELLSVMEGLHCLYEKQKIIIIESMGGRTVPREDGGCCFICRHTTLGSRMHDIMLRFMDFECTNEEKIGGDGRMDLRERYDRAVATYLKSYEEFGKRL